MQNQFELQRGSFAHTPELVILRYIVYKSHQRGSALHVTVVDHLLLVARTGPFAACTHPARHEVLNIYLIFKFKIYSYP